MVTWTNTDDELRIVRSDCGRSRSMATDESLSLTFDKPGTYHCTCSIHPRMIVTIVIE